MVNALCHHVRCVCGQMYIYLYSDTLLIGAIHRDIQHTYTVLRISIGNRE